MTASAPQWVADPTVVWNIVLAARLTRAPDQARLSARLADVAREHGWSAPALTTASDPDDLVTRFSVAPAEPLLVGTSGDTVVVAAHHQYVDGLGLLGLLGRLCDLEITSSARGLGEREVASGGLRALLRRLGEVALRPPARVAAAAGRARAETDTCVARRCHSTPRVADLVVGAAAGVATYNLAHGRPARRVVVAVGASRRAGDDLVLADRSALLRLHEVERLSLDDVRRQLRELPPEAEPGGGGHPLLARVMRVGLRLLSARLGSTVLVSHLGEVHADGVEDVAFYPVTGGGSGVSLGCASLIGGPTTVTLRSRGTTHGADALEDLLERIDAALPN
ncbi:hypothetical protein [Nocardioides pacificus]